MLDDGLARLNLTEARSPGFEVLICGVWHEAPDVDVGDALWVLQALGQAEFFLVGPQSWNSTRNGWVLLSELVQVDHFVALVVTSLHRLDGSCNVLLSGSGVCWVLVAVVIVQMTASDRRSDGPLLFRRPRATASLIECRKIAWDTVRPVVALHGSGIGVVDELGEDASGGEVLSRRGLLTIE